MHKAILFLVQRPVGVLMSFFLILILSVIVLVKIPVSLFPDVDISKVTVILENNLSDAEVFEDNVVRLFRNNFLQLNNLVDIYSRTDESNAVIELTFDFGTQMDYAFLEVNEKIDLLLPRLEGIKRPLVTKYSITDIPSLYLTVSSKDSTNLSFADLSAFVENNLKSKLEQSKAISYVDITGLSAPFIRLRIHSQKLNSLHLSVGDIIGAFDQKKGKLGYIEVKDGDFIYNLRLGQGVNTIEEIAHIPFVVDGLQLELKDIATIESGEEVKGKYLLNGKQAVNLAIIKESGTSYFTFNKVIDEILQETSAEFPNLLLDKTKNENRILDATIHSQFTSLIIALIGCLFFILFSTKSLKTASFLTLSIISSLLMSSLFFYIFHISFNLISISGLILGIGLMIDNAIIVMDNIQQKSIELKSIIKGSVHGTSEVITALLTSGITTCSIFFPLFLLSGLAGILFYDEAMSIAICLFSSFLTSIILLPTLYVLFIKKISPPQNEKIKDGYVKTYHLITRKIGILSASIILIIIAGIISFASISKEKIPEIRENSLAYKVIWNENIMSAEAEERMLQILTKLKKRITQSEVFINTQAFFVHTRRKEAKDFEIYVELKVKPTANIQNIKSEIYDFLSTNYPKASIEYYPNDNVLNNILNAEKFDLQLISKKDGFISDIEKKLLDNFPNIVCNTVGEIENFELEFNYPNLKIYDIDESHLLDFIQYQLGAKELYSIQNGIKILPVLLEQKIDIDDFLKKKYKSKDEVFIALKKLISLRKKVYSKAVEAIGSDKSYILNIKTNSAEDVSAFIKKNVPHKEDILFRGKFQIVKTLQKELVFILILTVVFLFFILAIQFNSLLTPLIILIEIPIGIAIAGIALYTTGHSLNIMSFIGILMMTGVVINDSILKIDLINTLVKEGHKPEEAVHLAGKRRLFSIIATSVTTILAVMPVFFQHDLSAQLQTPLIIPLVFGLLVGTFISIYLIPYLYIKTIK